MIITWIAFAITIGLLFTGAAFAAERFAKVLKLPTRLIWVAAMVMSLVWPIVASVRPVSVPTVHDRFDPSAIMDRAASSHDDAMAAQIRVAEHTTPSFVIHALTSAKSSVQSSVARVLDQSVMHRVGQLFVMVWAFCSFFLLGRLLNALRQLRRREGEWRHAEVDGMAVRVSDNVGPAVFGIRTMEVVLPAWVLGFDVPLRKLILRHEAEHRAAGDPLLLLATMLVVALVPWNLALWWQAKRIRLAIEVDCDDRVLAAHPERERYGALLLTLAQRAGNVAPLLSTALIESPSHLERRILVMRNRTLPVSRRSLVSGGAIVLAASALACSMHPPTTTAAPATFVASPSTSGATFGATVSRGAATGIDSMMAAPVRVDSAMTAASRAGDSMIVTSRGDSSALTVRTDSTIVGTVVPAVRTQTVVGFGGRVAIDSSKPLRSAPDGGKDSAKKVRTLSDLVVGTPAKSDSIARGRIRRGGSDPIVIVDGVRAKGGNKVLEQLDPNSIAKIDVLKGASASAEYGSDAANGVIVITTKKGAASTTYREKTKKAKTAKQAKPSTDSTSTSQQ